MDNIGGFVLSWASLTLYIMFNKMCAFMWTRKQKCIIYNVNTFFFQL